MNKENIKFNIILFAIIFGACTLFSSILLTMIPAEDNIIIDGDDIVSYNIINEDEIEIIMNDGTVYTVKLGFNDEVIDFTVSSDIYIEIQHGYSRNFFWDEFKQTDSAYSLNRIIKIPTEGR